MNFWKQLKKPFFVLAPMADVTDAAFRQIILGCGRPEVFFTEFVSCEGLCSPGRDRLLKDLRFSNGERPIVAQFFGSKPEHFYTCAQLARELGFDGIDINMGCPDKKVLKQGSGIALCKNPGLAQEIIKATRDGAGDLPVSVKTRLGLNSIDIHNWIPPLLEMKPAALTIHGRTAKEMSNVPAHWDKIGEVAAMAKGTDTVIIGNGDVLSKEDGRRKAEQYGLDGIMVGRGIFQNPWFFNESKNPSDITAKERLDLLVRHSRLFVELWGGSKNFSVMKKFYKVYVAGWDGAKDLRTRLMNADNLRQVEEIINGNG
ncbi:MAG: tRNA-dihydrouridine synthase [Candidatus Yanofskybacteria bacterium]|nr:tRNA-dihydrouridine synthase [Candidatus Yanofskybacteria bacterium]